MTTSDRSVPSLSQERLKELLHYDPETGVFTRRIKRHHRWPAGSIAGTRTKIGYVIISLDDVEYGAHRLAWLYCYGEFPPESVDHRDMQRDNNRIANLRLATNGENLQNQRVARRDNKSGFLGVATNAWGYAAYIAVNKKTTYLGSFKSPEAAHAAYLAAKAQLHPFQTLVQQ